MTAPARISRAYLRERIEAGDRPSDIARDLGVHPSTVCRHLRLHDIPYSSKPGAQRVLDRRQGPRIGPACSYKHPI
ncbi:hypothetical protein GCM10007989_25430 [Devosia pacifica]|uniref:Uncharacterized protein n=1 Tax=Devosia pacifica TaxID=1335967 RepID=A0A918SA05_9HYPH|nr:hypothetical protein GCM10007989_25430 [Devosia pacifica]